MPDISPDHPAIEAAQRALANDETNGCMIEQHEDNGMWTCLAHGVSADGPEMCWYVRDMTPIVLAAAREHYTAADLRNTSVGRELMAEGKSAGWDDALNELRKGQGMQRALAGTINTRKPNYKEARYDRA